MLAEEVVLTVFWFHPAMWWAIGQLQLSREQVVDALVVARTGARQPYMSALLTFTDRWPSVAPAIPYIRRRHLASRLRQLAQEKIMSRTRLALAGAALIGILAGTGVAIVSALPLQTSQSDQRLRLSPRSPDPVTITFKNAPLTSILSFVGMAGGITITYEKGFVDVTVPSVDVQNATIEQALTQILSPHRLSYRVVNDHTILVERRRR
jgi:hypothetical protein